MTPAHGRQKRHDAAPSKNGKAHTEAWFGLNDAEAITGDFLMLTRGAMKQCGSSSQTLAALFRFSGKSGECFASLNTIADMAVLSRRTVELHLKKLARKGAIVQKGKTMSDKTKKLRLTKTYKIADAAKLSKEYGFCPLPRWAAAMLPTWAERAVFAAVASRAQLIEAVEMNGKGTAEDREAMSLRQIQRMTFLTRDSIAVAKDALVKRELIVVEQNATDDFNGMGHYRFADDIRLNGEIMVDINATKPASGNAATLRKSYRRGGRKLAPIHGRKLAPPLGR